MNSLREVAGLLRRGKRAVICGHSMPDGDSIGSVLAMSFLLRGIGVECSVISPDNVPDVYGFLPGFQSIRTYDGSLPECDMAVILDCTDLKRLGDELGKGISGIPVIINIDHHISNQEFGTCNYVDSGAAATGEIVYELANILALPMSEETAVNIYTAIVMDTGSFRFDNTTARTHEITADLVRKGINTAVVNQNLFEKKEFVQLKLLGYALDRLQVTAGGRIAWTTIPFEAIREIGAQDEHADGIINYPRMLEGVEIGLLFREVKPGLFKVGFRSRQHADVNRLAAAFGGGGHPRASGCSVEGSRTEVEEKVLSLCIKTLENGVFETRPLQDRTPD